MRRKILTKRKAPKIKGYEEKIRNLITLPFLKKLFPGFLPKTNDLGVTISYLDIWDGSIQFEVYDNEDYFEEFIFKFYEEVDELPFNCGVRVIGNFNLEEALEEIKVNYKLVITLLKLFLENRCTLHPIVISDVKSNNQIYDFIKSYVHKCYYIESKHASNSSDRVRIASLPKGYKFK